MSEEDFNTYIDFGASKIRIGIFDKNFSRLIFFSEKKWLSAFNSKHLIFSNSLDNTMQSISAHSSKDADKWPLFMNHIKMLTDFMKPVYFSIPPKIKNLLKRHLFALGRNQQRS